jgi:hypothetical protein
VWRLVRADALLELRTYRLDALDSAALAGGALASELSLVQPTVFKACATARLRLPFLLARVAPRVLYVDWDAVVVCDLTALWAAFGSWASRAALVGMALNDPTGISFFDSYVRRPDNPAPRPSPPGGGLSSGVMLFSLERLGARARALEWWRAIVRVVRARVANASAPQDYWTLTAAFPLGDQDIINEVLAAHPDWLAPHIDARFNYCLADVVAPALLRAAGARRAIPCVVHFCGDRLLSDTLRRDNAAPDVSKTLHAYVRDVVLIDGEPPPNAVT